MTMPDLDSLIRDADPARDLAIPDGDPAGARVSRGRGRPPRRRVVDALAAGGAIAVALGVALVVLLAGPGRSPIRTTRPSAVPAAARPLVRILGVLRRPQSAADRSAASRVRGRHVDQRLIHAVALVRWREQLALVPRLTKPATLTLTTTAVEPGREITSFFGSFTASQIEEGGAWGQDGARAFGRRFGTPVVMVVPDGVARVVFALQGYRGPTSGWSAYAPLNSKPLAVRVHDNIAYAQLSGSPASVVTRWNASDGRLLKVTRLALGPVQSSPPTHSLGPPAINLAPGIVTVARLHLPDGTPFALNLQRILFEHKQYVCLEVTESRSSSQQCGKPLPMPDRPLVAVMGDPVACKPYKAQLVWGLALTDVTVALRAGGHEQVAVRRSIPAQLGARGSVFYVWARSAPNSLVARTAGGRVIETYPINSSHVLVQKFACAALAHGGTQIALSSSK